MPWTCFLITPTTTAQQRMRRYSVVAVGGVCPHTTEGMGHHAEIAIADGPVCRTPDGDLDSVPIDRSDPRWQQIAQCACGYRFTDDDAWQIVQDPYYVDLIGSKYTVRPGAGPFAAPAGALWEAPWSGDARDPWNGADGKSYMVRLPDGTDWNMDGPSTSGPGWRRTGEVPRFTVQPSILSRGYHGWFVDGTLSDDLEGRKY